MTVITIPMWEALKQATGRAKHLEHLDSYYESRRDEWSRGDVRAVRHAVDVQGWQLLLAALLPTGHRF